MSKEIIEYVDGGRTYLELHALRAPVGNYSGKFAPENDRCGDVYNSAVEYAIEGFEAKHGIELFCLGRSARHICIADTPRNRRRYASLRTKAIDAAHALWRTMRK